MNDSVQKAIEKYQIELNGRNVMVCVSGGADSMSLLHYFAVNREKLGINSVFACHFHHGLRDASDGEEAIVKDFCSKLGVTLFTEHGEMRNKSKPQGESIETWARNLRYEFFFRVAEQCDALILTAHNQNDNAETLLLNLSRGSGISGTCGIPPKRGGIVRPLILTSRETIIRYCSDNSIPYVNDESNDTDDYSRNKIRHHVIPYLAQINSGVLDNISEFCDIQKGISDMLDVLSLNLTAESDVKNGYDISVLTSVNRALTEQVVVRLPDMRGFITRNNIIGVMNVIEGKYRRFALGTDTTVLSDNGVLKFEKADTHSVYNYCMRAVLGVNNIPFGSILLEKISSDSNKIINSSKSVYINSIDCDKIKGYLYFASRQPSASFSSLRRKNTKSIKKLFNEMKIPPAHRDIYPVLYDESGVVWVAGEGVSSRVSTDDKTKHTIYVSIIKEGNAL